MKQFAFALIALSSIALSVAARADGFTCQTQDDSLNIKVYDHTHAEDGTRNAAVMVFSDPSIGDGHKTIARFTDVNQTLSNQGTTYEAKVDLRFNDSNLAGRNIGGTKLGFIDRLTLDVAFGYSAGVRAGDAVSGKLTILKRNGEELTHEVECTRYLKN